ncbi:MAG: hypothetical protein CM1200mP2_25320 [Planctomycetaceae bacterium]|nr:MAG: hypothetical protein CM1200mP2_25320 [Planctomycetaceae bacterium]
MGFDRSPNRGPIGAVLGGFPRDLADRGYGAVSVPFGPETGPASDCDERFRLSQIARARLPFRRPVPLFRPGPFRGFCPTRKDSVTLD